MLSAQSKLGDVLAWDVTKEDGPFSCPACKEEVLVKKGRVRVHHFAHIPPCDCIYGVGESEIHRTAKVEIYQALSKHSQVTKLKLERYMGEVRPDISFYLGNVPIAIEVQVSTLSLDTIDQRTRTYTKRGIYLLWLSPYSETHTHLECDTRLLRNHRHGSQAAYHRFQMLIQSNHLRRFSLQMLGHRVVSTGVRLILVGKVSSALGACPQRLA
jgi:competence CoiA-like predicted nuclease